MLPVLPFGTPPVLNIHLKPKYLFPNLSFYFLISVTNITNSETNSTSIQRFKVKLSRMGRGGRLSKFHFFSIERSYSHWLLNYSKVRLWRFSWDWIPAQWSSCESHGSHCSADTSSTSPHCLHFAGGQWWRTGRMSCHGHCTLLPQHMGQSQHRLVVLKTKIKKGTNRKKEDERTQMWSEEMSGMTDLKDKNGHASRRLTIPLT